MFDLTTYVKKWRIRQLKTVFSTLDTLCEAAEHYNIEESTISVGVPKKTYFQQKYSKEVIITTNLQILNLKLVQLYRL